MHNNAIDPAEKGDMHSNFIDEVEVSAQARGGLRETLERDGQGR